MKSRSIIETNIFQCVYESYHTPATPHHTTLRQTTRHRTAPRRAASQHNTTQHNKNITDNSISCTIMKFSLIDSSGNTTCLSKGPRSWILLPTHLFSVTWSNKVSRDTACYDVPEGVKSFWENMHIFWYVLSEIIIVVKNINKPYCCSTGSQLVTGNIWWLKEP